MHPLVALRHDLVQVYNPPFVHTSDKPHLSMYYLCSVFQIGDPQAVDRFGQDIC